MRITTQMINETAKKAGLPIHQTSLLDYINKNEDGAAPMPDVLKTNAANAGTQKRYDKLEKAAGQMYAQIQKFTADGEDSVFKKAEASGSSQELCGEAEALAQKYNRLLSELSKSTDAMDVFYKQSLKSLVHDNSGALDAVGISVKSDGSLKVDSDKFSAAPLENIRAVLGEESPFVQRLSFVTAKVGDYADSNKNSLMSSYLPNGTAAGGYVNKYNFWG